MAEKAAVLNAKKEASLFPIVQASTLPYYDFAGLYFNPAYGTLSLCAYPPPKHPGKECDDLISDARSSLHPLLKDSVPSLLATWSKIWSTHVLLRHSSGDYFNASSVYAYPAPFPNASDSDDEGRPFAVESNMSSWRAQFVFGDIPGRSAGKVEGMAWKGLWGAGLGVESPKGEGREGAEVWFDRVV
jgi:hypothetical protein